MNCHHQSTSQAYVHFSNTMSSVQRFSKWGPSTSTRSSSWKLVRNANTQVLLWTWWNKTREPIGLCLSKPSRWFWSRSSLKTAVLKGSIHCLGYWHEDKYLCMPMRRQTDTSWKPNKDDNFLTFISVKIWPFIFHLSSAKIRESSTSRVERSISSQLINTTRAS